MTAGITTHVTAVEAGFGIDSALEQRVKTQATRFRGACRRTIEEAWKLGGELRQAKRQVRHGQWIPWLEDRIDLTARSAQRLMALHEAYPDVEQVSLLHSVSRALRALPSGAQPETGDGPPSAPGPAPGPDSASDGAAPHPGGAAGGPGDPRVVTAARKLSRVVEGLEPVLHERPDGADVRHEFSALYDALQTIVSVMIGYADTAAGGEAASGRELVSALEAALAKARGVRDSVLAQEGDAHRPDPAGPAERRREPRGPSGFAAPGGGER